MLCPNLSHARAKGKRVKVPMFQSQGALALDVFSNLLSNAGTTGKVPIWYGLEWSLPPLLATLMQVGDWGGL